MRGPFPSCLLGMDAAAPWHPAGLHGPWKAAFPGNGGGAGIGGKKLSRAAEAREDGGEGSF